MASAAKLKAKAKAQEFEEEEEEEEEEEYGEGEAEQPQRKLLGFLSLKLAIMSGSACPPELVRWLAARLPGCAVTQLWGMTETQAALYTRPGDALVPI